MPRNVAGLLPERRLDRADRAKTTDHPPPASKNHVEAIEVESERHPDKRDPSEDQQSRAELHSPPALILDEATSSIDTHTEKLVQEGMDRLMKGRTTFVIAHRLSTVKNSDCIMVLENGEIIERGTHDELIAEKGRYYTLYTGLSAAG